MYPGRTTFYLSWTLTAQKRTKRLLAVPCRIRRNLIFFTCRWISGGNHDLLLSGLFETLIIYVIFIRVIYCCECSTGSNMGYAFVNFTNSEGAWRLHRAFHMMKWDFIGSKKICEITYARIQVLVYSSCLNFRFTV